MKLCTADFTSFFQAIHNCRPFPWQQALVDRLAADSEWPDMLDLPTGSGKTAALDAAVFHLALCKDTPDRAALRIAFVVDRRLVVDDAYARAKKIEEALCHAQDGGSNGSAVVEEVAKRLQKLAGRHGPPLVARRLRGGMPLEDDWARTPMQPTILCSTVDQIGSRLLFRGYGVSDTMKPVHAGLLGSGSLILLDEAHLAEPFRQTLHAVRKMGQARVEVAVLSATPGNSGERAFSLSHEDRADSTLRKRLEANKPALLKRPVRGGISKIAAAFSEEALAMADRLRQKGAIPAAVGVVVNRVDLARRIFDALDDDAAVDVVLLIGRSRSLGRDAISEILAPFRTDEKSRAHAKPLFVVATQCLEVGVDLDLDGLVTQAASLDALRQRFGRLNRAGRSIHTEGTVIAVAEDISKRADDPVYGDRIRLTWNTLGSIAEDGIVDFGLEALPTCLKNAGIEPDDLASECPNAPVVMPAYIDLWSQTNPSPTADPEVGIFLHGTGRKAAGVSIVWRADISGTDLTGGAESNLKEVVRLVPPRAAEMLELPIWIARAWLAGSTTTGLNLSDAPQREFESPGGAQIQETPKRAFRWAGNDSPNTGIVKASQLRVGDVLIIPAEYGRCDKFGWAPESNDPVMDVADEAAEPYWGRRCAVRITDDIVQGKQWDRISNVLAAEYRNGSDLRDQLLAVVPSTADMAAADGNPAFRDARKPLEELKGAKGPIDVHFPYADGRKGGAILVSERGVERRHGRFVSVPTTEDNAASSTSGKPIRLEDHLCSVAHIAEDFAQILHSRELVDDLKLAARLHDAGKADPRFQTMLAGGDPWNRPDGPPLAKSGRSWSPSVWNRAGLPKGWRHEALSVQMAQAHPDFAGAHDQALVLWLIGTHHGRGRPFFEFKDPSPEPPWPCLEVDEWRLPADASGPQSLAFEFDGLDWPSLFEELKRRYGTWGLAHLEAILRLADHRASEQEGKS